MNIHLITKSMQLYFLQSTFSLKLLQINDFIWVQSLSFVDYLLWRRIKLGKLNGTLSGGLNCFAACYAFVLKDTGVKEKYYFIKHHNSVSLAPVTNVCLCLSSSVRNAHIQQLHARFCLENATGFMNVLISQLKWHFFYISEAWIWNELLTDWCTTDLDWVCSCKSIGFLSCKRMFQVLSRCSSAHLTDWWHTMRNSYMCFKCLLTWRMNSGMFYSPTLLKIQGFYLVRPH